MIVLETQLAETKSAQKGRCFIMFMYLGRAGWRIGKQISQEEDVLDWDRLQE